MRTVLDRWALLFLIGLPALVSGPTALCGEPPPAAGPVAGDSDICVYGGTSAGVIAAVQAAQMGKRVVLIAPDGHLGGITTSGLGATDRGSPRTVSGLARAFYRGLYDYYSDPGVWKYETRAEYIPRHPGPSPRT